MNSSQIDQVWEDNDKLAEQVHEVQEALRHLHEELQAKLMSITNKLDKSQAEVEMLRKEKEQSQHMMEGEKQALIEEIEHMKGILAVERLESREQIESVQMERDDLQAKLEAQIDGLEERLTEAQEEAGEVYARNHKLESGIEWPATAYRRHD